MELKPEDSSAASAASYPNFYPHITLASQLPATMENPDTLRSLIPWQDKPLTCSFASIEVGDVYFRSVYIAIKPSIQLLDLHKGVHENLQIETRTPSFPHLSLVYIADEDANEGERMKYYDLLQKGGKFKENYTGDDPGKNLKGVSLICRSATGWMDSFDATEVWAVKCDGSVESWEVKGKYPFVRLRSS